MRAVTQAASTPQDIGDLAGGPPTRADPPRQAEQAGPHPHRRNAAAKDAGRLVDGVSLHQGPQGILLIRGPLPAGGTTRFLCLHPMFILRQVRNWSAP